MKRIALLSAVLLLAGAATAARAGFYDTLDKLMGPSSKEAPREEADEGGGSQEGSLISGLKEALAIGTENAVKAVARVDGYLGNELIRILVPDKLQTVADVLSKMGYQDQVDAFVTSMNRAAEKAAPQAISFFTDAVKEMTFEDAKRILDGGDTAATDYFESKTREKLYAAFKPIVSSSMDEVRVTQAYKEMVGKYTSLVPFARVESLDLDHYVTTKALDGLFYMVGQEEKKIRTDPAARVTELLKKVFERD